MPIPVSVTVNFTLESPYACKVNVTEPVFCKFQSVSDKV